MAWSYLGSLVTGGDSGLVGLNHAGVTANTSLDDVGIYVHDDGCHFCPFTLSQRLKKYVGSSWQVDVHKSSTWRIMNSGIPTEMSRYNRSGLLCELRPTLKEYGSYSLDIGLCELKSTEEPMTAYLPLIIFFGLILTTTAIYALTKALVRNHRVRLRGIKEYPHIGRDVLHSVNVFRGLLLCFIILITTGFGGYGAFTRSHSGISLPEVLFGSVVWTFGVTLPTNIEFMMREGCTRGQCIKKLFMRAGILVLIGTMVESKMSVGLVPDVASIWRPLQRIGVAYFVSGAIYGLTVRELQCKTKNILCEAANNFMNLIWCWILGILLMATLFIILNTLVFVNCLVEIPLNYSLDRFAIQNGDCNITMATEINKLLISENERVYVNGFFAFNKGLFGIISSVIMCMIGLSTGVAFQTQTMKKNRLKLWLMWSIVFLSSAISIAGISCLLNFNLWPLATTILIPALTSLIFPLIYCIVETNNLIDFSTLNSFGQNCLLILGGHILFSKSLPFDWGMIFESHLAFLVQNIWILTFWIVICLVFNKKGFVCNI